MARAQQQRRSSRSRKEMTVVEVDFSGVEAGGRSMSNGWAHGRVKKAKWAEAKESGNQMVEVQWAVSRGKEKATVFDRLVNTENALWRFKQMLESVGIEVPDGAMDVDVSELVDLECDVLIENEDYDGKDQPRVVDYRPAGAGDIDEDAGGSKKKRRAKDEEENEEEEEEEEDTPPPRSKRKSKDEEEEEEEEDDDPPPRKKRSSRDEEEEEEEDPPARKKRSRDEEEEEDEPPARKKKRTRDEEEDDDDGEEDRPKIRKGSKVKFEDEGKTVKGVVKELDSKNAEVETTKGDVYEVDLAELELA